MYIANKVAKYTLVLTIKFYPLILTNIHFSQKKINYINLLLNIKI